MMNFVKMEGCANDFIVTGEVTREADIAALAAQTPRLCDRRRGIGADGILLVTPSQSADWRMRVLNADGSEAEMCGNGIRCCAVYLRQSGLCMSDRIRIETGAGIITAEFRGDLVRVNMGAPILDARRIPVAADGSRILREPLSVDGREFVITAVSMGNPHAVIFADDLSDELVLGWGPKLEKHPFFPRRTNVEFVKVLSPREVDMRVFERGVGETLACGTGACATAVAAMLNDKADNQVTVHLLGGDLLVEWDRDESHPVFMTGPATWVYQGCVEVS